MPYPVAACRGAGSTQGGSAGNDLLTALVAYWPGNEASGNLLDAHTNALHFADTNTVTNNTGKVYATARQFTALTDEYFYLDDNALLDCGNTDFTIAAWVYMDSKDAANYIYYKDAPIWLFYLGGATDAFRFVSTTAGGNKTATATTFGLPSVSTWYLVVGWHDSAADAVYIQVNNGTADSAVTGGSAPVAGVNQWIGRHTTGLAWNGRIGPVMFWKSTVGGGGALSVAKRTALYNSGNGLAYASFT